MQKILITGITGGLGTALKNKFEKNKFKVYGHSCNKTSDIIIDFRDPNETLNMKKFIENNDITCMINNAAIYSDVPFYELSDKSIIDIFNTNLIAPILISKYFYQYILSKNKKGLIVNINSIAGKHPSFKESIYSSSKFGLNGFGTSLSTNQKNSKISVIDCYLGGVKTNITKNREDYNTLIDANDAAEMIFNIVLNKNTGLITSFEYRKNI